MDPMRGSSGRVKLGPGGEFDLIRSLIGPEEPASQGVLLGPGDDCAVLAGGLVVSVDLCLEGIHFKREWITLEEAGYRAAAAALSDVAAMAGEPLGLLLSMALDPTSAVKDAEELQRGVWEACRVENIQILGGDLSRSPGPLILDVVVLGRSSSPISRAGTEVGDEVWVTGWLGGSAAAVRHWDRGSPPPSQLREAFAHPRPRIREALWLSDRASVHGLIDLSDGLAGDAGHLASASGLCLVLKENSIPVHPALFDSSSPVGEPLHLALAGGEDYELCLTVPPGTLDDWVVPFQDSFGVTLTKVGWAKKGEGVFLESVGGEITPLGNFGFSHFSGEEEG